MYFVQLTMRAGELPRWRLGREFRKLAKVANYWASAEHSFGRSPVPGASQSSAQDAERSEELRRQRLPDQPPVCGPLPVRRRAGDGSCAGRAGMSGVLELLGSAAPLELLLWQCPGGAEHAHAWERRARGFGTQHFDGRVR